MSGAIEVFGEPREELGQVRVVGHDDEQGGPAGGDEERQRIAVGLAQGFADRQCHLHVHEPRALVVGRPCEIEDVRPAYLLGVDLDARLAVDGVEGAQAGQRVLEQRDDVAGKSCVLQVREEQGG